MTNQRRPPPPPLWTPPQRKVLLLLAGGASLSFALMYAVSLWIEVRRPAAAVAAAPCAGDFDLVIRNGRVLSGRGDPAVRADVGVRAGRIVCVGSVEGAGRARVVDAAGLVVAPGFIDVHTHVERNLPGGGAPFQAPNFVRQGVTTIVTGNCGRSSADVGAMLARLERDGSQVNVATLVGHNTVRNAVMQRANRAPAPGELEQMKRLVAAALDDGALGLSTGLGYVPGVYAKQDEVVALASEVSRREGMYVSHIRDEGEGGFDAVAEAINVGHQARLPVHISHFKAAGHSQWGNTGPRLQLVEEAQTRGQRVTIDQYPYNASSTSLDILLPADALADDRGRVAARLRDPQERRRVIGAMLDKLKRSGETDYSFARIAYYGRNPTFNGLSIPEVTARRGAASGRADGRIAEAAAEGGGGGPAVGLQRQAETILDLVAEGGAQMIYFDMSPADVAAVMSRPYTMFGSDSSVRREDTQAVPHPRGYGTFPRVLSEYVRANRTLTLEEAVRRMTWLPAQTFGLARRGQIAPDFWADLVIFDEQTVADRADYDNPLAPPAGISTVIVNGRIVFEAGSFTTAAPGKPLRRQPPGRG